MNDILIDKTVYQEILLLCLGSLFVNIISLVKWYRNETKKEKESYQCINCQESGNLSMMINHSKITGHGLSISGETSS